MNTGGAFVAGSIVGKLLLDKTGWNASIKSVDKDTAGLIASAERISAAHQKVGVMFAGVGLAVVGSLAAMVKKTADFGDKLFDLSQITGISAATLSSFKLAADKSGTSLEGLAIGLRFLNRNMASAMSGTGAAANTFQALRISVTDAYGKLRPTNDVLMEIADRFSSLTDEGERVALAMRLFGRSGAELIPFLRLGRGGLEELRKEAERLGIVMSDSDAAASDKFKDALVSLKASVQGIGMTIGKILIPAGQQIIDMFTRLVSGVTEVMNKNGPFTQSLVEMGGVFGIVATAAGGFHLALALGLKMMASTAAALQTTVAALAVSTAAWTAAASAVVFYILKLQELETAKARLNQADENQWEAEGRVITKLQEVARVAGMTSIQMEELYNSYGIGNVRLAEQAIALGKWEEKFPGITAALEQVAAKSRATHDATRLLSLGIHGLTLAQTELLTSQNATFGDDIRGKIKAAEGALAAYIATGDALPRGIRAFEDYIRGLRDSLKEVNPILAQAAQAVVAFGRDVSNMSRNPAFDVLRDDLKTLGAVVGGALGKAIDYVEPKFVGLFEGLVKGTSHAKTGFSELTDSIKALVIGGTIEETKAKIEDLQEALLVPGLTTEKIRQLKDELARLKAVVADSTPWGRFADAAIAAVSKVQEAVQLVSSAVSGLVNQARTNAEIAVENEYQTRLAYINKNVMDEETRQQAIQALEAEYQIKRAAAARKGAALSKAVAMMEAVVNTASGVARAFKDFPFPLSVIIAGIVGALGAVQVGLIAAQPIPLAEGASFEKPTLLQNVLVGEKRPEYLLDKPKLTDIVRNAMRMPAFMGAPAMAMAGGGGGGQTINATLNFHTTGLSRRDLELAGDDLLFVIQTKLRGGRRI